MVAIIHFNLVHPIMMGAKKCRDVQFYTEVGDVVQTLDGGRRSMVRRDVALIFFFCDSGVFCLLAFDRAPFRAPFFLLLAR
jgi:hypothetical protein